MGSAVFPKPASVVRAVVGPTNSSFIYHSRKKKKKNPARILEKIVLDGELV